MLKMTNDVQSLYRILLEEIKTINTPCPVDIEHEGTVATFYIWQKRNNGPIYIATKKGQKLVIYSVSKKTGKMEFVASEYTSVLIRQGRDPNTGFLTE